jgi:hypothetical protein
VQPSVRDVQVAVENYYLQYRGRVSGPDVHYLNVRCAPISALDADRGDGERADVRFRFAGQRPDGSGGESGIFDVMLRRNRGSSWFIPREVNLQGLPCEIVRVKGLEPALEQSRRPAASP